MALRSLAGTAGAALALALLAGCGSSPPPEQFPELGWQHLPPIKLNVAKLEVVNEYQPRVTSPHVETLAPRSLLDSADRWARDRLKADGDEGYLRFVVTDASLVEAPLPLQQGLTQSLTNQQARRYTGHVAVRLELHNRRGYIDAQAMADATNSQTVPQDVADREVRQTWYLIVQGAMLDLNAELDRQVRFYMARYLEE
ncbi:MAG: hypothetical protein ACHQF3_06050 [Alphaproteobacteria bacterium]